MKTLTYVGPAGERRFRAELDEVTVDLAFPRGEAVEVSDANAKILLDGPHAGDFVEGKVERDVGTVYVEAGESAGAMTDTTGDIPAADDNDPGRASADKEG